MDIMNKINQPCAQANTGINRVKQAIKQFHLNKNGDVPVGPILVVALISIPLVITLIIAREELYTFLIDRWAEFVLTD